MVTAPSPKPAIAAAITVYRAFWVSPLWTPGDWGTAGRTPEHDRLRTCGGHCARLAGDAPHLAGCLVVGEPGTGRAGSGSAGRRRHRAGHRRLRAPRDRACRD